MASTAKYLLSLTKLTTKQLLANGKGFGGNGVVMRQASFLASPQVRPLEKYPNVEVVENPPEWKYLERLMPKAVIPKPVEKPEYPSGWTPPTKAAENAEKFGYLVTRTKNHMIPVYLQTKYRGLRRLTIVKRIQGDIWALEKDLKEVAEKARGRIVATRINEMSGQIHFHGDFVDVLRDHLKQQGF